MSFMSSWLNISFVITMSEVTENGFTSPQGNGESVFDVLLHEKPVEAHTSMKINTLIIQDNVSDDESRSPTMVRKRIKRFSDSDSEVEADKENVQDKENVLPEEIVTKPSISSESEDEIFHRKSRLRANSDSSDGGSPAVDSRIGNKRNRLQEKFKILLSSRSKVVDEKDTSAKKLSEHDSSSDDSGTGIESIKQKIKKKSLLLKSDICDPDTSSDEGSNRENRYQKRPKQKSTLLTSPKPIRMSAKQAMENLQKIKSESNRMLREKEVSLPYHRPKALSLKDIMSRRKTALSADGKALPVKMNSDQLKQYVKLLEQRNKEIMELCKSDTEEEETTDNAVEQNTEPTDTNSKEPTEISTTNESKFDGNEMLPDVTLSEETNEEDLPDLTVEIVFKEQEKTTCATTEKDDEIMKDVSDNVEAQSVPKNVTNDESQLIELHYETERIDNTEDLKNRLSSSHQSLPEKCEEPINIDIEQNEKASDAKQENYSVLDSEVSINENINSEIVNSIETSDEKQESAKVLGDTGAAVDTIQKENSDEFEDNFSDDFSDGDINMEYLEAIIENAKRANNTDDAFNSPTLIKDPQNLNVKPRLMGAPGMVIDLDGTNPGSRKLTGVELLKERFTYYSKLKTPEEKERERELKIKPGMQHLKLKQELEDQISEQRSLEWAKRLADEKQQQMEMDAVRGDQSDEDDIDKIEAKLEGKEKCKSSSGSEEDEEEEEIYDVKEKPRKRNPMVDDEAEESGDEKDEGPDDDETEEQNENAVDENGEVNDDDGDDEEQEDSDESSDDSSEDEEDNQSKPRKGRILKAFEDSDDESSTVVNEVAAKPDTILNNASDSQSVKDSQDDLLPLAQTNKSISEDLFASQASIVLPTPYLGTADDGSKISDKESSGLGTQTFSILNTNTPEQASKDDILKIPDHLDIISETQPIHESSLDDIVGMCSGKFTQTQNVIPVESQISETQCAMGEDVLALCTGKFYDNQFVSQIQSVENSKISKDNFGDQENIRIKKTEEDKDLLDSILKEMNEPANEVTKTNKYVFDNAVKNESVSFDAVPQAKKKFVIESDEEGNIDASEPARKKKLKKRKLEKRALQISDDEADEEQSQSEEQEIDYISEFEDDGVERVVEYDSEENEVEVRPQNQKKKWKMAEFFEQEAELTSEDEWVGSGDEDEAGLDRMEREEGDYDTFHQGKLQRELGQIHMRDVLDQDKREVRLIQELLFEDGDLGDGHRQRKFRWKDLDGDDETGPVPNIFGDSQEEEFESEEQWRKQRHEREVFLRNMQKEKETEDPNISIDRTTIIKANLCSKTMSSLLLEVNGTKIEETTNVVTTDKKSTKEEQAPFSVFKQNYHGSLLTRGRGALARLAALALPLAGEADDDKVATVGPSSKRNFVFAAVSPATKQPKVNKRKADNANVGTPRLIKKLKTDDKQISKSSLLDHLRAL